MTDKPFIQSPELLTRPEKTRDAVVTAVLWAVYAYLWLPLVSLVAWLVGYERAYEVMVRSGGAEQIKELLIVYAAVVLAIVAAVAGWSLSNRWRFRGRNRRRAPMAVTDEAIAAYFGLPLDVLGWVRGETRLYVELDDAGRLQLEGGHASVDEGKPCPERRPPVKVSA